MNRAFVYPFRSPRCASPSRFLTHSQLFISVVSPLACSPRCLSLLRSSRSSHPPFPLYDCSLSVPERTEEQLGHPTVLLSEGVAWPHDFRLNHGAGAVHVPFRLCSLLRGPSGSHEARINRVIKVCVWNDFGSRIRAAYTRILFLFFFCDRIPLSRRSFSACDHRIGESNLVDSPNCLDRMPFNRISAADRRSAASSLPRS